MKAIPSVLRLSAVFGAAASGAQPALDRTVLPVPTPATPAISPSSTRATPRCRLASR